MFRTIFLGAKYCATAIMNTVAHTMYPSVGMRMMRAARPSPPTARSRQELTSFSPRVDAGISPARQRMASRTSTTDDITAATIISPATSSG